MDPAMPDNPSTDSQPDEALRQVGRFLYHFALLEKTVNALIGKALDLNEDQTSMVAWAIQTRRKIDLLEAAINDQKARDKAWKERACSTLKKVHDLSDDRNMVAHSLFESHQFGGVSFERVTIGGPKGQPKRLQRKPQRWTAKQLDAKCERMNRTRAQLERIRSELRPVVADFFTASPTLEA